MKIDESEQINHVERTDHCGQANNGVDRLLGGNETVKHSTANFFGWILALEKAARTKNNDTDFCPLGEDGPPRREAVRFINDFGMAFPTLIGQDVSSEYLNQGLIVPSVKPNVSRLVRVAFMGLIGGTGVLPLHYTRLVLSRLRQKDTALYDFFNLFTHRLVSLFYRSWMKYRLPYQFSQARLTNCEDNITAVIRHLSGVFSARKRNVEMYYAGHFARRIKSAQMLSAVLSDFLRAPVRIKQFQGRWLTVSPEARTTLCTHSIERASNTHRALDTRTRLGEGILLGRRVWDLHGGIEIEMGPVSRNRYQQFMLGTDWHERLQQLIHGYTPEHLVVRVCFHIDEMDRRGLLLNGSAQLKRTAWLGTFAPIRHQSGHSGECTVHRRVLYTLTRM